MDLQGILKDTKKKMENISNPGNQDIDIEKTRLNYNLAEEKNQLEFIKKRTSEIRCLNRKDINVMCDWVVTLPEKIKTQEEQELFSKKLTIFRKRIWKRKCSF